MLSGLAKRQVLVRSRIAVEMLSVPEYDSDDTSRSEPSGPTYGRLWRSLLWLSKSSTTLAIKI